MRMLPILPVTCQRSSPFEWCFCLSLKQAVYLVLGIGIEPVPLNHICRSKLNSCHLVNIVYAVAGGP